MRRQYYACLDLAEEQDTIREPESQRDTDGRTRAKLLQQPNETDTQQQPLPFSTKPAGEHSWYAYAHLGLTEEPYLPEDQLGDTETIKESLMQQEDTQQLPYSFAGPVGRFFGPARSARHTMGA